jgi:DNA-binding MarR family transcriptional regulator
MQFLQHAGPVRRTADPADRHRVTVSATSEGLAKVAGPYGPIGDAFVRVFDDYTDEELGTVLRFMRDGSTVADAEIDRIRGAGVAHATRSP